MGNIMKQIMTAISKRKGFPCQPFSISTVKYIENDWQGNNLDRGKMFSQSDIEQYVTQRLQKGSVMKFFRSKLITN